MTVLSIQDIYMIHLNGNLKNLILKIRNCVYFLREKSSGYKKEKAKFLKSHGYSLNLKSPHSFSEKLVWKKIYDRNPLLPLVADKHRVRDFINFVLGEKEADKILIPQLYVTDKPEDIPFDDLPEEYIIKANHGSGTNIIVEKGQTIDREQIIKQCKEWLSKPYGYRKHEWAYQKIKRKIIVEKLLRDENGNIPKDFKIFVFHGKSVMIQVDHDRFTEHVRTLYRKDWEFIEASMKFKMGKKIEKPSNLGKMIELAESIGSSFDFIRVDLYSINNQIYFGEMTNYPGSGMEKITPKNFDYELGKKWEVSKDYWKKSVYNFKDLLRS